MVGGELPRISARAALQKAMASENVDDLRAAIAMGIGARLPDHELDTAKHLIAQINLRMEVRAAIAKLVDEGRTLDMEDINKMREFRGRLAAALKQAKEAGLGEQELKQADQMRRQVHNAIEDLKGAIRVFCRVRPLSKKELARGDSACL